MGDTPWSLLTDYTPSDVTRYLDNRRDLGFTVVQTVICWEKGTGGCGANWDHQKPFVNDDPTRPNLTYFRNVDAVIDAAAERGVYVALLPVWGQAFVIFTDLLNETNARQYGRFLGNRYRDKPNVIWMLGGDTEVFTKAAVFRELGDGIREGDGGAHIMGYHSGTYFTAGRGGSTADPNFNPYGVRESKLDFHTAQSWAWFHQIPDLVRAMYSSSPTKPAVLAEGAYELQPDYPSAPITPLHIREQAWWTFLSGGFYTYGNGQIWSHGKRWREALDSPGALQLSSMKADLMQRRWWRFVPDKTLLPGRPSAKQLAARSLDGETALVYSAGACSFLVRPGPEFRSGSIRAVWINPATWDRIEAGVFDVRRTGPLKETAARRFTTPKGWPDALLVLSAEAR